MAIIVDIDHEAGNFSEYDSTQVDGGDLSIETGAALANTTYGMQAVLNDSNSIWGAISVSLTGKTVVRSRFYFDPNGVTSASSTYNCTLNEIQRGIDPWAIGGVRFTYNSGHYLHLNVREDDTTQTNGTKFSITDAPHWIEWRIIKATTSSSADGSGTLWIDGVFKETLSGLDNYNLWESNSDGYLGALLDEAFSGTMYLDEWIVRDDDTEIGPRFAYSDAGVITPTGTIVKRTNKRAR